MLQALTAISYVRGDSTAPWSVCCRESCAVIGSFQEFSTLRAKNLMSLISLQLPLELNPSLLSSMGKHPNAGKSQAAPPDMWRQRSNKTHLETSAELCQRTQRMSGSCQSCSSAIAGSQGEPGCAGAPAGPSVWLVERSMACQKFVLYSTFQAGKPRET